MRKNNILILSHDYYPNNIWGTGKNVYDFINNNSNKYNIVLYTSTPRENNKHYKIICPTKFLYDIFVKGAFIENNSYRDANLLAALNVLMIKKIDSYYENIKKAPDLILNHGWMTYQIAQYFSKKYNIKIISFVHFFEKQFLSSNNFSTKTDWNDIYEIENNMFNESDKLIVFSDNQKESLSNLYKFDNSKIRVIPHSVTLPKIATSKKTNKKTKILFVGRLINDKGIKELIIVFEKLCEKYNNLELNIVGDGVLKKYIEELDIKNINLLGYLEGEELYKNYVTNDIFCFPSKTETFGLVLLEAMNYKIPIVTTEGKTVANIIENNKTGLTVKLYDNIKNIQINELELYSKLEKMINNRKLREKLSSNAYSEYMSKYKNKEFNSVNKMIGEVINE